MYWSSAAAPQYTTFNGYGVLRTTPTTGTLSAISTQTYNNLPTGSQPFSVVAVFKPNSLAGLATGGIRILFSAGNATASSNGQLVYPIALNGYLKYTGGAYGGLGTWLSTAGIAASTSQYVVMVTTFNGTTERVYINGIWDKSATMTPTIPVSSSNKVVLGCSWYAPQNMDADVGVLLMYNRALSSSEAAQMYSTFDLRFAMPTSGINV